MLPERLFLEETDIAEALRRAHDERQLNARGMKTSGGTVRHGSCGSSGRPADAMTPEQILLIQEGEDPATLRMF